MSLDDRLRRIEDAVAARRYRTDPIFRARVSLQCAMMDASVPAGDDGTEERKLQLAEVARLRKELESLEV